MFFMPPMSLGLTRYSRAGGSGIPFDPSILFSNGERGAWYDPSDLTTLFQDAEGTIPVTADGDPVGLMLDKSGNGNHLVQPATASRPTYRTDGALHWLEFDGADDWLSCAEFYLAGSDKLTVISGVYKRNAGTTGSVYESGTATMDSQHGTFGMRVVNSGRWYAAARGTTPTSHNPNTVANIYDVVFPDLAVLTAQHDLSDVLSTIRRNGVPGGASTLNEGSGNFVTRPLYIGNRGNMQMPFPGSVYGLIIRLALTEGADLTGAERWIAAKAGVTL